MCLYTPYRTPMETCTEVQKISRTAVERLVARPWNRHAPEKSHWWLVPSGDWPAYHLGKIFFDGRDFQGQALRVGMYFEKGLASRLRGACRSARAAAHIMEKSWHWFELVRCVEDGHLCQHLTKIGATLPVPVELILSGYACDPENPEPYGASFPKDKFFFNWNPSAQVFEFRDACREANVLKDLSHPMTFLDLSREMQAITSSEWTWVDFYLAITLQCERGAGDATSWEAADLWARFLSPLWDLLIPETV